MKRMFCRPKDELIVLGLVVSIFVSLYTTIAAMAFVLIYMLATKRFVGIVKSVKGSYVIWAFAVLNLIVSVYYENWMGALIALGMWGAFTVTMYVRRVMTRALLDDIMDISCLASLICFVGALVQQHVMAGFPLYRAGASFFNANYYGTMIEFIVLFCLYKLINKPGWRRGLFYSVTMLLNLYALLVCDCRMAVVGLGVAIPLMLLLNRKYKILGVILGFGAVVSAVSFFLPQIPTWAALTALDFETRVSIWQIALKGIAQHPLFGQGAWAYARLYAQYGGFNAKHSHSLFLDPLLDFGFVGTSLLLYYLVRNCMPIFGLRKEQQDHARFAFAASLIVCLLVHGLMDITLLGVQTGVMLLVILAIAGIRENHTLPEKADAAVKTETLDIPAGQSVEM